jgi:hypothetical protein
MRPEIPQPWGAFLSDLDARLTEAIELVCGGGFVMSLQYGLARPTADVDVVEARPRPLVAQLLTLAGRASPLHRTHGVYLDLVTVSTCPDGYEDRLTEMFPGVLRWLRFFALDPYDLALSKLDRNAERDREDVYHLARTVPLDLDALEKRYKDEMWPYLGVDIQKRADGTLSWWVEAIEEERRG